MALPDIFDKNIADGVVARINKLSPASQPVWGKMTVGQMLAHCNVTYEMVYENKHKAPKGLMKLMLKQIWLVLQMLKQMQMQMQIQLVSA